MNLLQRKQIATIFTAIASILLTALLTALFDATRDFGLLSLYLLFCLTILLYSVAVIIFKGAGD